MATFAASKARRLVVNARVVTAIELLTAAQAIDLRLAQQKWDPEPTLGPALASIYSLIRQQVPFIKQDTVLSGYIEQITSLIADDAVQKQLQRHQADLID